MKENINIKENLSVTLRNILADTKGETAENSNKRSLKRLKQLIKDAPPIISFGERLARGYCLIAEIKEESPSQGRMRSANVEEAPSAYKASSSVNAVSVLTNRSHFGQGMTVQRMLKVKDACGKPVLRKDFITENYQIYEARAFGADAILLMANILDRNALRDLSDTAFELGMDVLFETHSTEELELLPKSASVIGINCRSFNSGFTFAKWKKWLWGKSDASTNTSRLDYVSKIQESAVKIAESGVTPDNCADVFSKGFNAALVGTSLLQDVRGVHAALADFEKALSDARSAAKHVIARQAAQEFA